MQTHGAERGLDRFEGFSDAVFAIALTLLIVEIKVPGSPEGPHGYSDLASAMAEQWREFLALVLCYVVIGAYWLQHHYSGRIYAKTDHWFGALNLLFLLAIVVIPYPIRVWCFHLGTRFEPRRIGDPGCRPRPDRLHLDGEVVLRNAGPAGDGRTARARFPPADDAPLRHRDADPDRRSSGRDRGAARRSGASRCCASPSSCCRSPSRATSPERSRARRRN